jgi:hypothetical protein
VTAFAAACGLYVLVGCGVFFLGALCLLLLAWLGAALDNWWYGIGRPKGGQKGRN